MALNESRVINPPTLPVLAESPIFEPNLQTCVSTTHGEKQSFFALNLLYSRTNEQIPLKKVDDKTSKFKLFCGECGCIYEPSVLFSHPGRTSKDSRRLRKLVQKYSPRVLFMEEPKFITLTSPRFSDPRKGVKIVRDAFKKMRRHVFYQKMFKDVIYGFHIKTKPNHEFNVHIHALVDTPYIHQPKLAAAWAQCLPGAEVVDIRRCSTGVSGLKYILKDVVKAKDLYGFDEEIGASLKNVRLVHTAGTLWGTSGPAPPFPCPKCGATDWSPRIIDAGCPDLHQLRKALNEQTSLSGHDSTKQPRCCYPLL